MHPSRLLYTGFLLLASMLLAACSSSKPESTVEAFYQAAAKRDVDKVMEQFALAGISGDELLMTKGKVQMMVGQMAAQIEENGGIKRIEVLESSIDKDGDSARVQIKLIFNDGSEQTESNRLRREGGKWKILMQ